MLICECTQMPRIANTFISNLPARLNCFRQVGRVDWHKIRIFA